RCKTDTAIRKLAEKGGVIGISMVRPFVGVGSPGIENLLDHIDHIARLVGVEHVGIGTDVDLTARDRDHSGAARYDLQGIRYEKKIFDITEGLLRRKYSRDDIRLILGGNFRRVLGQILNHQSAGPEQQTA